MKYIINISESFKKQLPELSESISGLWGYTDEDIFNILSELNDEFFNIEIKFGIRTPSKSTFYIDKNNYEKIESYISSGMQRIIRIEVEGKSSGIRRALNTAIDDCQYIDDYYIETVSKFNNNFTINLCYDTDKSENIKSKFHRKSSQFFEKYMTDEIKQSITIEKVFLSKEKITGDLSDLSDMLNGSSPTSSYTPTSTRNKKLYVVKHIKSYPLSALFENEKIKRTKELMDKFINDVKSNNGDLYEFEDFFALRNTSTDPRNIVKITPCFYYTFFER